MDSREISRLTSILSDDPVIKVDFQCMRCGSLSWIKSAFSPTNPLTIDDLLCDSCIELLDKQIMPSKPRLTK
jgi:hypothetical protein